MKKRILALLLVLTLLVLGGCTVRDTVQVVGVSTTTLQELADAALSDETEAPESGDQFVTAESPAETPAEAPQDEAAPADEVSRPRTPSASIPIIMMSTMSFYISIPTAICRRTISPRTKPARSAGRAAALKRIRPEPPSAATASATARGCCPEQTGRSYTECDINTDGADSRGAERLIFSNDGLYFYTSDHYASFTELTVDGGTVVWSR